MRPVPPAPRRRVPLTTQSWITVAEDRVKPGTQHRASRSSWILGLVLSGACEHGRPQGPRFMVAAGAVVGIAPGTPQFWQVRGPQEWHVISAIFTPRPHWLAWLAWSERCPGFMVHEPLPEQAALVRDSFRDAVRWSSGGRPDAADRAGHALERVLLECSPAWRDHQRRDQRIQRVVEVLSADLARSHQLQQLVDLSGYSRAQFLRRFRRDLGTSPMTYLAQLRLRRAQQLVLHSDLAVKTIATAVGIPDAGYFSRLFHRCYGVSPLRYRQRSPPAG